MATVDHLFPVLSTTCDSTFIEVKPQDELLPHYTSFSSSFPSSWVSPDLSLPSRWRRSPPSQAQGRQGRRSRGRRTAMSEWRPERGSSWGSRSEPHSPGVWLWGRGSVTLTCFCCQNNISLLFISLYFQIVCAHKAHGCWSSKVQYVPQLLDFFDVVLNHVPDLFTALTWKQRHHFSS